MATVWIPSLMRGLTGGLSEVQASGPTVRDVIDDLESRYPGIRARLINDGRLKPNIALVVDGMSSKQGLRHPLTEASEVHFVPAMSGGSQHISTHRNEFMSDGSLVTSQGPRAGMGCAGR
jgi:molybdopterin converting factor small subunit